MVSISIRHTEPSGSGEPTAPGWSEITSNVDGVESPAYPAWQKIHSAFSEFPRQEYAAREAGAAIIGLLMRLQAWVSEGKEPTEVHDPEEGVYGKKTPEGWSFLYAPLALTVQVDAALSYSSVEAVFHRSWWEEMKGVAEGRAVDHDDIFVRGFGSLPSIAPLFWAKHVYTGEDAVAGGGVPEPVVAVPAGPPFEVSLQAGYERYDYGEDGYEDVYFLDGEGVTQAGAKLLGVDVILSEYWAVQNVFYAGSSSYVGLYFVGEFDIDKVYSGVSVKVSSSDGGELQTTGAYMDMDDFGRARLNLFAYGDTLPSQFFREGLIVLTVEGVDA